MCLGNLVELRLLEDGVDSGCIVGVHQVDSQNEFGVDVVLRCEFGEECVLRAARSPCLVENGQILPAVGGPSIGQGVDPVGGRSERVEVVASCTSRRWSVAVYGRLW